MNTFPIRVMDAASPIRIDISVMDESRFLSKTSKVETAIAEILSKYPCFTNASRQHGAARGGTRSDVPRSSRRENDWRGVDSSSWNPVGSAKRPRIGGDGDPGTRSIRSLLNKINDSNFDAIQTKMIELISSGGVAVRIAVDALIEKSSNDGDGFTMTYTKLLAAICSSNNMRTTALECIGEFLHEIYGAGDGLWNKVESVSEATVRSSPTEDYDGFCAALKAKKKIYGRHRTALMILTLMTKDIAGIPGIPKPADAVAKLMGLMKCAVEQSEKMRDVAIEILLELVSQLSFTLAAVKKEAFVNSLSSLKSGLEDILIKDIVSSCSTQCRFRAEAVLAKLKAAPVAAHKSSSVAVHKSAAQIAARNALVPPPRLSKKPAEGVSWRSVVSKT